MKKLRKYIPTLVFILIFIAVVAILWTMAPREDLYYSDFVTQLNNDNVKSVSLNENKATVVLKEDIEIVRKTEKKEKPVAETVRRAVPVLAGIKNKLKAVCRMIFVIDTRSFLCFFDSSQKIRKKIQYTYCILY